MKWISIEEKQPEEGKYVLVYKFDYNKRINEGFIQIAKRKKHDWLDDKDYQQSILGLQCLVTHWMPLPEPPKE